MQGQNTILIVDDNPNNVFILEELLGEDYQLATASSGEEALSLVQEYVPALILLDIMMPGINGYETCRRIRALPPLRHMKIIMVSANGMLSERLQGYAAGADDYIMKSNLKLFLERMRPDRAKGQDAGGRPAGARVGRGGSMASYADEIT